MPFRLRNPPWREVLELEIPARPEFVALVRLVVSSVASTRRVLAEERIDDVKLAVSEACTNAIEAHGAVNTHDHVVVRLIEGDDRLEVLIDDRGRGFDPATLPEHPPVTHPERLNFERGLGTPLSTRSSTRSTSTPVWRAHRCASRSTAGGPRSTSSRTSSRRPR